MCYYCGAKLTMKITRLLLLPFSFLYGGVLWFRNLLYNKEILKSSSTGIKSICVGNISLGGTGKTPHIEYIIRLLHSYNTIVLSRGYGRKHSNTLIVESQLSTVETGDEPLQIARKFPNTKVVVDGNRLRGMEFIETQFPKTDIVLLDDAFQHRRIKAGLNILLTTYEEPFTEDYYLPAGNLRDHRIRARQADIIIVTKCPEKIDTKRITSLRNKLLKYAPVVLFDQISYNQIIKVFGTKTFNDFKKIVLITGIAKPQFLYRQVVKHHEVVKHYNFRDHYQYTSSDLKMFRDFIGSFAPGEICVLTTEKDMVRMLHLFSDLDEVQIPLFYWEIGIQLNEYKSTFDNLILNYAKKT